MGNQNNMVLDLMDLTKLFSSKINIIDKLYANYKGNSDKKFLAYKICLFGLVNSLLNVLIHGIYCLMWAIISHLLIKI